MFINKNEKCSYFCTLDSPKPPNVLNMFFFFWPRTIMFLYTFSYKKRMAKAIFFCDIAVLILTNFSFVFWVSLFVITVFFYSTDQLRYRAHLFFFIASEYFISLRFAYFRLFSTHFSWHFVLALWLFCIQNHDNNKQIRIFSYSKLSRKIAGEKLH